MMKDVRRGFTLFELLVVLAIMAVVAGSAAFSLGGARDRVQSPSDQLRLALDSAARSGIPVRMQLRIDSQPAVPVLILPDGRSIGAITDPLTSELLDAAQ